MDAWARLAPFDAGWAGIEYVYVLRGVDHPSAEGLRRAVALLHQGGEVLDRCYDTTGDRVRRVGTEELSARLDDMVRTSELRDPDVAVAAEATGPDLGPLPLRVVLGADWVALRFTHAFADGWSALHLISHLLRQARTTETMSTPWRVVPRATQELVSGVALLRHPRTLATAVRRRAEFRGGSYAPAAVVGAGRAPSRMAYVTQEGFRQRLSAEREEHHPGASLAALVLARVRAGLVAAGREPEPGAEVLFDVRGAFGATQHAFGNFIAPITVRPDDDEDPVAITERLRRTHASGLPLVAAVGGRLRGRLRPGGSRQVDRMVRVPTARPRLAVSYLGRHGPLGSLPWDASASPYLAVATTPNGPGSIGVTAHELPGGRLSLSLSWYDGFVDAAVVRGAVEAVVGPDTDV